MRNVRTPRIILILLSSLFFMSVTRAPAQEVQKGPMVIYEERHDTSPPMREMPSRAPQPGARGMALSLRRPGPARVDTAIDSALQQSSPAAQVGTTNGLNFDGVSDRDGVAPPDTNASVGASQVVETVNFSYQVFDKATGASVFGPAAIASIWTGFGGLCETGNLSDPVVLYDKAAGRWVIAIVAFNYPVFSSNEECVAVSTTSNATGSFNRYAFSFGSDLNDYTKIGVWPDAYYLSANIFPFGGSFIGPQACALNRTAMLAGSASTMQCFQRGTSDASLLPADLDGTTVPPTGSPNFFLELGTSTTLDLWPSAWAPIATPALRRERAFRSKERHNNSILWATGSCFAWPIAILEATSRWLRRTRSPRGAAQAFVGMKSRAPMRPRRSSNPAHLHLIRNLAGCRVSPWTKREISPSATAFPAAACSPPLSTPGAYRAMHWVPWKAKLRFLPDWGHKQAG